MPPLPTPNNGTDAGAAAHSDYNYYANSPLADIGVSSGRMNPGEVLSSSSLSDDADMDDSVLLGISRGSAPVVKPLATGNYITAASSAKQRSPSNSPHIPPPPRHVNAYYNGPSAAASAATKKALEQKATSMLVMMSERVVRDVDITSDDSNIYYDAESNEGGSKNRGFFKVFSPPGSAYEDACEDEKDIPPSSPPAPNKQDDKTSAKATEKFARQRRGYCMIVVGIAILILIITLAVRGSGSGKGKQNENGSAGTAPDHNAGAHLTRTPTTSHPTISPRPTVAPSLPPTMAPTTEAQTELMAILQAVTPAAILTDPSTPQHQAFRWMAQSHVTNDLWELLFLLEEGNDDDDDDDFEDDDGIDMDRSDGAFANPMDVGENATTTTTTSGGSMTTPFRSLILQKLMQRYAVTVLDFALHGQESSLTAPAPLIADDKLDECDWQGIVCTNLTDLEDQELDLELEEQAMVDMMMNMTDDEENELLKEARPPLTPTQAQRQVLEVNWPGLFLHGRGSIPREIGLLTALKRLDVAENELHGELPPTLFQLTQLESLYLHDNHLTGTLSEDFSKLQALQVLHAGQNKFKGHIPQGLLGSRGTGGDMARPLHTLSLFENELSGPLPHNVNLRFLWYLDLGRNQLTGTIPADWVTGRDAMVRLRHLYLDHNRLRGSLPRDMFRTMGMGRLEQVVLSDNQFTGFVPGNTTFAVSHLQHLVLHNNFFSSLSPEICDLSIWNGGQCVNFRADCYVCGCGEQICGHCYK